MAHATVFEHVEAGDVKPRSRVSVDALELAATWLESYEGDPDDDRANLTDLATVAAELRARADRRTARAAAR
jgi:hypothetical protein